MIDKTKLGTRYTCFSCGTKFYDLLRPEPLCPECGSNQQDAPVRSIRELLSGRGRVRDTSTDSVSSVDADSDGDDDDDEFDDLGIDDDDDDSDDSDDSDDDDDE